MAIKSIIGNATHILRTQGIKGLMYAVSSRMCSLIGIRAASFQVLEGLLRDKRGIEIGGPSQVFSGKGIFPVYPIVEHLDNCNFGSTTVWEGEIRDGQTFKFVHNKAAGRQFIVEATAMACLPSGAYDFVLASHILEHTANPILALSEWKRLLRDQGTLVMLLPLKDNNFDHRRPVTTMEHLIADFTCGMTEDDLTHMPEILALHDLGRDPEAGDLENLKERSKLNFENRCFHHHVFDTQLAVLLMDYVGMRIKTIETIQPTHILIASQKLAANVKPNNSDLTGTVRKNH